MYERYPYNPHENPPNLRANTRGFFHHPSKLKESFVPQELYPASLLKPNISIKGLKLIEIPGDGNCLFNAISLNTAIDQQELRYLAGRQIIADRKRFAQYIPLPEGKNISYYLAELVKEGTWGGQVEIIALMEALERPIYVIGPEGKIRNEVLYADKAPIFIYYNDVDHYDTFVVDGSVDPQEIVVSLLLDNTATEIERTLLTQRLCTRVQLTQLKEKKIDSTGIDAGEVFLWFLSDEKILSLLKNKYIDFEQILQLPSPGHLSYLAKALTYIISTHPPYPPETIKASINIETISKLGICELSGLVGEAEQTLRSVPSF